MVKILLLVSIFIILFLLSAFFSMSETALVSLSHYRLKKLILKNKSFAGMLNFWISSPQYILTSILIGNNVVNISITTIATALALGIFARIDPRIVEGFVWIIVMIFILVFGEITPKIFGRRYPEALSMLFIRPLYYMAFVLKPLVILSMHLIKPFAFGAQVAPIKHVTRVSAEEIKRLIKESEESGYLGRASTEMMQRALLLNETAAGDIMTKLKDTEVIDIALIAEKNRDLIDEINEIGHSRIPVIQHEKTNVIGYINVKDIYVPSAKEELIDLKSFIRQPLFMKKGAKLAELLKEFKATGILIAMIRDEHGKICGLVTMQDVLEQIVGKIVNEYEKEQP